MQISLFQSRLLHVLGQREKDLQWNELHASSLIPNGNVFWYEGVRLNKKHEWIAYRRRTCRRPRDFVPLEIRSTSGKSKRTDVRAGKFQHNSSTVEAG